VTDRDDVQPVTSSDRRDDVHVRAAALLALYYDDPRLKVARYEELTDDLLAQKAIDADIYGERRKQEQIWGAQEHADEWWLAILTEEVGEAAQGVLHEHFGGDATVRYEVVQIAAVAQAWLECIDLRAPPLPHTPDPKEGA